MLGVQLIERKRGGIALTEMGKITERRAHDIVTGALDLMDYTRHQASVLTGPLNLGVIPSIAPYLLPRALAQLQERFPGLQLKLRETDRHAGEGGERGAARRRAHIATDLPAGARAHPPFR